MICFSSGNILEQYPKAELPLKECGTNLLMDDLF